MAPPGVTHFLYVIIPPRETFAFDAKPDEIEIMIRHAEYYRRACADGLVLMAGPTYKRSWGVCILDTDDLAVAERFRDSDPAVTSGLMTAELHPWKASIRRDLLPEDRRPGGRATA